MQKQNGKSRLCVLSIDSLMAGDLEGLRNRPHFARILENAAVVKNVREIYPTLTYPIHTTIITGVHPSRHGISHNQKAGMALENPDWSILGSDWYWYREAVQVETLVEAARRQDRTTSTILWPVMAGGQADHNLAEIWPSGNDRDLRALMTKTCSPSIMADCFEKHIASLDWVSGRPGLDDYGMPCAVDIIRRYRPDVHLQHIVILDHDRHVHGVHAPEIERTLDRVDGMVGEVLGAYREAGILEETNFVLLGDHGQIDIQAVFELNVLFRQAGLIRTDAEGKPVDYDAFAFSAGFSSHIFLKCPQNPELVQWVRNVLEQAKQEWPGYVERIMTHEEVLREEGLSGGFTFVIEGTPGTMFHNHLDAPVVRMASEPDWPYYRAMHGHSPDKGEKPPFIAFGPDVAEHVHIENGDMLDICPTLAALAGIQMTGMTGSAFPITHAG